MYVYSTPSRSSDAIALYRNKKRTIVRVSFVSFSARSVPNLHSPLILESLYVNSDLRFWLCALAHTLFGACYSRVIVCCVVYCVCFFLSFCFGGDTKHPPLPNDLHLLSSAFSKTNNTSCRNYYLIRFHSSSSIISSSSTHYSSCLVPRS